MEVSDQIIKVIDKLAQQFGVVVDWTQKNVVPYVQDLGHRITLYEIYTSIAWIVIGIMLLIFGIIITYKSTKMDDYEMGAIIFSIGIILNIASIIVICTQAFDIIQAITIPEATWIEYLNNYKNSLNNR